MGREADRVLTFWWTFELFNPQRIVDRSSVDDDDGGFAQQVVDWKPGQPLPWERARDAGEGRMWEHTVYLDVYERARIYGHLHEAFDMREEIYDERSQGQGAGAAFLVDEAGRIVENTTVLSSAMWGLGRVKHPGPAAPGWLDGFGGDQDGFRMDVLGVMTDSGAGAAAESVRPLDGGDLIDLLTAARDATGVSDELLATGTIRIKSLKVKKRDKRDDPPRTDFLNSFYLHELTEVREAISRGSCGAALMAYLTPSGEVNERDRRNVQHAEWFEEIMCRLGADRIPAGRWPSNPEHPLALSQQFAVNEAIATLASGAGLMGVNGPPGTGKTTMLRDIIAANVVERARRLALLTEPHDAFVDDAQFGSPVPRLREEFTGFEMVVVSSNNNAVENISNELPASKAVDDRWHSAAEYFSETATDVLLEAAGRRVEVQAWGLIAARLGKRRNRNAFADGFWFGTDLRRGGKTAARPLRVVIGDPAPRSWEDAVSAFDVAHSRVEELLAERLLAQRRREDLVKKRATLQGLPIKIAQAQQFKDQRKQERLRYQPDYDQANKAHLHWSDCLAAHEQSFPGAWENVKSLGQKRADWRTESIELNKKAAGAKTLLNEWADYFTGLQKNVDHADAELNRLSSLHEDLVGKIAQLDQLTSADEAKIAGYPDRDWFENDTVRQCRAPWLDAELDTARSELFLAALDVHQAFVRHNERLCKALWRITDVVQGKVSRGLSVQDMRAAWRLFFLVVPVVSTTFASVRTMFGELSPEFLGWLFIDEAGQATPQEAVGAMWRSRRAVAVGDPNQLKPVVTMPAPAEDAIARSFAISDVWVPSRSSVQSLADRVGVWGTELLAGAGAQPKTWVSAPLRVHRRCDDPMFTVCNDIAYGGIMIKGHQRADLVGVPASAWIDVPEPVPGKHLQYKEIRKLGERLDALLNEHEIEPEQIFVISPFKVVVGKINDLIERTGRYQGIRGGTIHSVQGQEAQIVIFVLGGDPKKPGAKTWASQTPNLVNVAVSRAQRRLYVIGDHASWSEKPYFEQLAHALEC